MIDACTRWGARLAVIAAWAGIAIGLLAGCGASSRKPKPTPSPDTHASYAALVGAGSKLLGQGNVNAAEQLFRQAIAKDPTQPVAYYDLGVAYQGIGDRRDALGEYKQALVRNRAYTPALYNEAVLLTPENAPLAMFYYRQVIGFRPDSPTAYLNLGLLQVKARAQFGRNLGLYELHQAMKLDPSLRAAVPAALRTAAEHAHQLPKQHLPQR